MIGGMAPASYFLLRRCLAAGARPSALIIDGEMLFSDPLTLPLLCSELFSPRECLELVQACGRWTEFGQFCAGALFSSWRRRGEIRAWILAALQGQPYSLRGAALTLMRNWSANRGAQILAASGAANFNQSFTTFCRYKAERHPLNVMFARRFLKLAALRQIRVFWLVPPVSPELQARRDPKGMEEPYLDFLHTLQEQFPNLVVVDGRHSGYDDSACADVLHLNRQGAFVFSTAVAGLIESSVGNSSRWVILPGYHPPTRENPLEDLLQSHVALRKQWEGRRQ
jgi:hypothetical protein